MCYFSSSIGYLPQGLITVPCGLDWLVRTLKDFFHLTELLPSLKIKLITNWLCLSVWCLSVTENPWRQLEKLCYTHRWMCARGKHTATFDRVTIIFLHYWSTFISLSNKKTNIPQQKQTCAAPLWPKNTKNLHMALHTCEHRGQVISD